MPRKVSHQPEVARGAMTAPQEPVFREMTREECDALLDRHVVGRLAYTFHDRVGIEPIHYVHDGDWLFGRTSRGSKLDTLAHHPWVAFEVDEVNDVFEWKSVVLHGTFYHAEHDGPAVERAAWERAVVLLRRIVPATMTANDPVAFRDVIFRVHIDEITGREARGAQDSRRQGS